MTGAGYAPPLENKPTAPFCLMSELDFPDRN